MIASRCRYTFASERFALAGLVVAILACPVLAEAQAHRARLAQSLANQLATNRTGTVQALVQASQSEVDRLAKTYGVRIVRRLALGALLSGTTKQVNAVAGDRNVSALAADDVVTSTMAVTPTATGANQLWRSNGASGSYGGITGLGIGVAIIDSGVAEHPEIVNRLRLRKDFTGEGVEDAYGHGTHVAGIIAGSGDGSRTSDGNAYVGMAPGAEIISLKVLGSDGTGSVSNVIEAIEWAIDNRVRYRIRIINLSLGHPATIGYRDDPMAQAVERAVAAGLVVVSSAGNLGKTADGTPVVGAVVSPGFTPGALTVGALNTRGTAARSDDGVASYSSRGPVGDQSDPSSWELKPDVVAPGNAIVSAGVPGTYLWDTYPDRRVDGASGGTYLTLSGSSMGTAVVSGAVAQLLQLKPSLSPSDVKFALQFTAQFISGFGLIEQGAGSIDVPLAAMLVDSGEVLSAPTTTRIAGELVQGWHVETDSDGSRVFAFGSRNGSVSGDAIIWGNRSGSVGGDAIIWGNRGGSVGGDAIIWGNRGGSVGGDAIIWGNRGGSVGGDAIIWGNRGGSVGGDAIIWGNRGGSVGGDAIIWGNRGGSVGGDAIIWGNRGGSVGGDAIIWGNRGGSVGGDAIIWGNRGGSVGGDAIIWGNRGGSVGGDAIIWGNRGGSVGGDAIIWGNRGGSVGGDAIIWGNRGGSVGGDAIIWGNRGGSVGGDAIIWGNRGGSVGGDAIIWGNRGGSVGGDAIIWGNRGGSVGGDAIIWGNRGGSVGGDAIIWGNRGGSVGGDAIIWGNRGGSVGGDAIIWGNRGGSVGGDAIIWGNRGGSVGGDAIIWGNRGGSVGGDAIIWGNRGGSVGGDAIIWGNRGGSVGGDAIIWGNRGGSVGGDAIIWGNRGGSVGGDAIIWGNRGGSVGGDAIIWGNRGGSVGGDAIIWGNRGGSVGGDAIIWGNRGGSVGGDAIIWGNRSGSVGSDATAGNGD